jgi:heat shock protein HtpX
MLWFGNSDNRPSNPAIMLVGVALIVLAPIMAALIQAAVSRQREYLADATGALTTRDPDAMASALGKLRDYARPMQHQNTATAHLFISNPLKASAITKLFSTHPPLDDRIERLQNKLTKI